MDFKQIKEIISAACEKYGVKIKTVRIDIPKLAKEEKKGIEECAREALQGADQVGACRIYCARIWFLSSCEGASDT